MSNPGTSETEIKLAVPSVRAARRLLRENGFHITRPRVFESNTIFDTMDGRLRREACVLRVRSAGRVATFTYKGAPLASVKHKSRQELELEVSDPARMALIIGHLGFQPVFRYEKYRTEFAQPARKGVAVLDETPVGIYLELEGTASWIDRTARRLGFAEADYITLSYARLYLDACAREGREPGDMVFA